MTSSWVCCHSRVTGECLVSPIVFFLSSEKDPFPLGTPIPFSSPLPHEVFVICLSPSALPSSHESWQRQGGTGIVEGWEKSSLTVPFQAACAQRS